jgi:hypothetical protein
MDVICFRDFVTVVWEPTAPLCWDIEMHGLIRTYLYFPKPFSLAHLNVANFAFLCCFLAKVLVVLF